MVYKLKVMCCVLKLFKWGVSSPKLFYFFFGLFFLVPQGIVSFLIYN